MFTICDSPPLSESTEADIARLFCALEGPYAKAFAAYRYFQANKAPAIGEPLDIEQHKVNRNAVSRAIGCLAPVSGHDAEGERCLLKFLWPPNRTLTMVHDAAGRPVPVLPWCLVDPDILDIPEARDLIMGRPWCVRVNGPNDAQVVAGISGKLISLRRELRAIENGCGLGSNHRIDRIPGTHCSDLRTSRTVIKVREPEPKLPQQVVHDLSDD